MYDRYALCLDREQRLTYILGQIFRVTDVVAAEVLEVTCDNFRQRLARARPDLRNFMNDKCGLVNRANPCRCAKKTRGFIEAGDVDPKNLLFTRDRICEVREAVPKAYETIKRLMTSVRIFTVGTRSISRRIWGSDCGSWSRALISDEQPTCPDKALAGFDK